MLIGIHVSAEGGLQNIPCRAKELGGECFQFFSRSPVGGRKPLITESQLKEFQNQCQKYNFSDYYLHAPYFVNLASKDNRIYYGSISVIQKDLKLGSKLKAKYLMTHLGTAKELGLSKAINKVIEGISKILAGYSDFTQLLIENSAGAGKIIGANFSEIAQIIKSPKLKDKKLGICFDIAHAFESGYDLRTTEAVKKTFAEFDKIIGLNYLKLIHANDSKTEFGSRLDRHWHIGKGKIGLAGFLAILNYPPLKDINLILETPGKLGSRWDKINIEVLKKLRVQGAELRAETL